MSRLRSLLFWLLVLVLPLQGFAATSGLLCGNFGPVHEHAGDAHHPHEAARESASATPIVDVPGHACGLCAACCHAVAISASPQPLPGSPAVQADMPDVAVRISSLTVRIPDKPPRA